MEERSRGRSPFRWLVDLRKMICSPFHEASHRALGTMEEHHSQRTVPRWPRRISYEAKRVRRRRLCDPKEYKDIFFFNFKLSFNYCYILYPCGINIPDFYKYPVNIWRCSQLFNEEMKQLLSKLLALMKHATNKLKSFSLFVRRNRLIYKYFFKIYLFFTFWIRSNKNRKQ